jgi:hypothetical protein
VLLPLRGEPGGTPLLAQELMRQLGLGSEPLPAAPPAGRGDEASAAG